ncbi:unnamed protein product [Tilletia controversa]|uniref:Small RNA 2'-O-methyltransferase n=1 Tax=Tilletia controversa TaxID=13291 RepID=A0A8X7SWG3_9BASI|nr:hypothetical protein CF328_g5057 [Tilletia controversa]KAE8246894.1 hypothetical protein A4X06_0g4837 [Tilletia controversa]CAD6973397.1 unnamed protein product [Tilletia controversa]
MATQAASTVAATAPVHAPVSVASPQAEPVNAGASAAIRSDPSSTEPQPVFRPPLFEQRQGFILGTLRKHRVREVLEVGCERGRLLQYLAQPEFQVDTFPFHRYPPRLERRLPLQHWTRDLSGLVLERLEGLDLDGENLKAAVHKLDSVRQHEAVSNEPEEADEAPVSKRIAPLRFVPMRAAILQGGLEIYNERFRGIDAIVASEVIEHLHEPVLDAFAPILLGRYRPRLFIITTPNYAFNIHFPRTPSQPGIDDPTGRTERKFRHPDHKFEWDLDEFKSWCERAAERFGYEVEIGGLGMLNLERRRPRPRPRDEGEEEEDEDTAEQVAEVEALMRRANDSNRYASQTAVFKRLGKAPPGTGASSIDARSRSRSTARGVGLASTVAASAGNDAATATDTDGISGSDDFRAGPAQRGRDRSVDDFRRPSVVSGSESEVGPMQSFAVGSLHLTGERSGGRLPSTAAAGVAAAEAASGASTGSSSDGPRPSLQQSRRVSRSRKPENLPWLSNTVAEAAPASSSIDGSHGNNNDGEGTTTTSSPLANSANPHLLTSTGGLDGVSLTPTPTISMVQHKLLWEAEFPAVAPTAASPSAEPSSAASDGPGAAPSGKPRAGSIGTAAAFRRVQPKIAEAVIEILEQEAELVRVPAIAISGVAQAASLSPNPDVGSTSTTEKNQTSSAPTTVEARLPLWSAFRDDDVRRNVEGSILRLLAGLGLLPKTSEGGAGRARSLSNARSLSAQRVAAAAAAAAASSSSQARTNGGGAGAGAEEGRALLKGEKDVGAKSQEGVEGTLAGPGTGGVETAAAPVSGSGSAALTPSANASPAVQFRPVRDPSTVMATDGATWELRLLSRPNNLRTHPSAGENGNGDHHADDDLLKGLGAPRRAVSGNEGREGLVDGEDDGNEEDDEDDSDEDAEEEEDEEDGEGDDDALFSAGVQRKSQPTATNDESAAAPPRRTRVPNRKGRTPRASSSRRNNELYLIYFGPEPSQWLSTIEAEDAELDAEEAERERARQERREEVEATQGAIEVLGGWGHPSLAGQSFEEMDRRIGEVRAGGAVAAGAGDAEERAAVPTATPSSTGDGELTGWE